MCSPHLRSIPFWPVILSPVRSRARESAAHIKTQAQEDISNYFCCQHWVTENAGTYPSTGLSNHILGTISFKLDTPSPFPSEPGWEAHSRECLLLQALAEDGVFEKAPNSSQGSRTFGGAYLFLSQKCAKALAAPIETAIRWPSQMTCLGSSPRRP